MNYKDYDIANFITDEFFIQWIKNPNENNSHFWEKWMDQNPEKRAMVNEAANLIRSVKYAHNPEFTDKMYVETFEKILKADTQSHLVGPAFTKKQINIHRQPATTGKKSFHFPIRRIAASVLVLFCFWAQYVALNFKPNLEPNREIAMVKRSNPAGQKSIIDLPDGSRIHLNATSEIEFPQEFSSDMRSISLIGEAFFEIKKESRPFIVHSGKTKIKVLGTSFNVNTKEDGSLYVALVTGKVSINTENGSNMTLAPNEMLVLKKNGTFYKSGFDSKDVIGWKDKYLVFKSCGYPEVKKKLEQWYGVTIKLKGGIDENWTYSGIYKDELLENVLRGICMTSGMNYKIDKKQITIISPK